MDCKEFERLIPEFIDREMDFQTLNKFNEHMKKCDNCREELVIQFLVTEGMQRLEEGDSFDLQRELDERLQEARKTIRRRNGFLYTTAILESLIVAAIAIIIFWMVR
ncbi:MAG: zf-HC2 domain-containing protein [Lachnospiraceae bacterium]|nr:zf-HC2 domain-containing protein [Lachnospiraceae bacterium]